MVARRWSRSTGERLRTGRLDSGSLGAGGVYGRRLVAECVALALALFDEQLELGELNQTLGACARQPNAAAWDRRAADAPETRRIYRRAALTHNVHRLRAAVGRLTPSSASTFREASLNHRFPSD